MIKLRVVSVLMAVALVAGALAACAPAAVPTPQTIVQTVIVPGPVSRHSSPGGAETLVVFGAFAAPVVEPWDGVIHAALNKAMDAGQIEYTFTENLGYAGDLERVLRETAEQLKPDAIFGDAFGNEEAVRRVAADYPEIAFVFGSGLGPTDPNTSVFDNWIHEPAYLSGMLAGGLTKTGKIGVVGGSGSKRTGRSCLHRRREVNPGQGPGDLHQHVRSAVAMKAPAQIDPKDAACRALADRAAAKWLLPLVWKPERSPRLHGPAHSTGPDGGLRHKQSKRRFTPPRSEGLQHGRQGWRQSGSLYGTESKMPADLAEGQGQGTGHQGRPLPSRYR
jgi:hypothetical protein